MGFDFIDVFVIVNKQGQRKSNQIKKKTEPKTFVSGQFLDIDAWVCGACKHFHNTINNML